MITKSISENEILFYQITENQILYIAYISSLRYKKNIIVYTFMISHLEKRNIKLV